MAYQNESTRKPRVSAYLGPSQFPLVSWRALIAGLFVTLFSFALLISLGLGVGGLAFNEVSDFGTGMSWSAGIWLVASAMIALFAGSYFAGRVSNYITTRIGAAQGLVISSVFFALFLWQTGAMARWAGGQVTNAIGQVSSTVMNVADNPQIQQTVGDALQGLNLDSDLTTVIQGVATRILQGNMESARNYLTDQANITQQEADQLIQTLNTQLQQQLATIAETSGDVVSAVGWVLFFTLGLGALAGIVGGGLGSHENEKHPLSNREIANIESRRTGNV